MTDAQYWTRTRRDKTVCYDVKNLPEADLRHPVIENLKQSMARQMSDPEIMFLDLVGLGGAFKVSVDLNHWARPGIRDRSLILSPMAISDNLTYLLSAAEAVSYTHLRAHET